MIDQLNTAIAAKHQTQQQRLLTLHEVMDRMSMGRSFIYNEMTAGRIKPIKFGRAIRFLEAEIDQWISDRIASR
ncbi:AlpA family transcriptional regulator [Pusillimonas sp. ANT_WB101]|uniref:helix-turn-helix transcriptional regulator n=1 Tax=Pusillimonas sp. ANT_WB101 TaxID=2597356 RepID=UPI0011ED9270|nr:AlpA family phage regulatory protein [Pusillimonas sp. ANT_WB101]KAA0893064.1 helix-turn-helix domain-containing protein [Pusillimonas sp. ANT_WB101]